MSDHHCCHALGRYRELAKLVAEFREEELAHIVRVLEALVYSMAFVALSFLWSNVPMLGVMIWKLLQEANRGEVDLAYKLLKALQK